MKLTAMEIARANLLIDAPFFGALAVRLKPVPDAKIETAATNGRQILFNPAWFDELPPRERIGLLAHEILHVANLHHTRRGTRDHTLWNVACDYAINQELKDAGFVLPPGALISYHYNGKPAEQIYAEIAPPSQGGNAPEPDGGMGSGPPEPCPWGEVQDAVGEDSQPIPAHEMAAAEGEAKVMISQAAQQAKGIGKLPGSVARMVGALLKPTVSWREVLQQFVQSTNRDGHDWRRPNRRMIGQGLYLPRVRGEYLELVVAIDTSGSISEDQLRQFLGEIEGILQSRPSKVWVVYCDTEINRVDEVTSDECPLEVKACGGGGTDFRPVFDLYPKLEGDPSCLVYITDMAGTFPTTAPEFPVLWVKTEDYIKAPFGEEITMCP